MTSTIEFMLTAKSTIYKREKTVESIAIFQNYLENVLRCKTNLISISILIVTHFTKNKYKNPKQSPRSENIQYRIFYGTKLTSPAHPQDLTRSVYLLLL